MATPSVTYTFTNGTVIDASQHNTNYNDIISALTDGLKDLDVADIGATTGTITTLNTTTLTIAGITTISSGSVSAPGLAFSGTSSNTGLYLIGTDNMGFAANGAAVGNISSAGVWSIGVSGSSAQHVLNGRYIDIQGTSAGSTGVLITNATNSGNAHAAIEFNIGGTSGGDPYLRFNTAQVWACGVDNSDSDIFKISANATLGTFDYFTITAAGLCTLGPSAGGVTHRLNTNTQTTVGAAGAASALPANPTGYVIINVNGTDRVIPYYAAS